MVSIDKTLLKYLIVASLIRIPLLLIQFSTDEYSIVQDTTELFFGNNMQIIEIYQIVHENSIYPPVFFYVYYVLYLFIAGTNFYYFSVKLMWLVFDLLCIFYVYRLSDIFFHSEKKSRLYINTYILCPFLFLLTICRGVNEVITLFFIIASVYYFLIDKKIVSYVLMSVGFMYSFLPIFLIIPYFLYSLNQENGFKKFLIVIPIVCGIVILAYLPFLISMPEVAIQDFLMLLTRSGYSISNASGLFPVILDDIIITIDLSIVSLNITYYHLFIISIISLFFFVFMFKYKVVLKKDLIGCITCFFLLLPFLTRSFHFRLFYWVLPFLSLKLLDFENLDNININRLKMNYNLQTIVFTTINILLGIYSAVFYLQNPGVIFDEFYFMILLLLYVALWTFFVLFNRFLYVFTMAIWLLIFSIYYVIYFSIPLHTYRPLIAIIFVVVYLFSFLFFIYLLFYKLNKKVEAIL